LSKCFDQPVWGYWYWLIQVSSSNEKQKYYLSSQKTMISIQLLFLFNFLFRFQIIRATVSLKKRLIISGNTNRKSHSGSGTMLEQLLFTHRGYLTMLGHLHINLWSLLVIPNLSPYPFGRRQCNVGPKCMFVFS